MSATMTVVTTETEKTEADVPQVFRLNLKLRDTDPVTDAASNPVSSAPALAAEQAKVDKHLQAFLEFYGSFASTSALSESELLGLREMTEQLTKNPTVLKKPSRPLPEIIAEIDNAAADAKAAKEAKAARRAKIKAKLAEAAAAKNALLAEVDQANIGVETSRRIMDFQVARPVPGVPSDQAIADYLERARRDAIQALKTKAATAPPTAGSTVTFTALGSAAASAAAPAPIVIVPATPTVTATPK